jgi:hypothetical protein
MKDIAKYLRAPNGSQPRANEVAVAAMLRPERGDASDCLTPPQGSIIDSTESL